MAKVYFYYAAMNAGKSTALLQANHNYLERGMRTLLFTTAIDDRDGANAIVSRIGIRTDARSFTPEDDFLAIVEKNHQEEPLHCVLIDEAQFLTKDQVLQLGRIADELNSTQLTAQKQGLGNITTHESSQKAMRLEISSKLGKFLKGLITRAPKKCLTNVPKLARSGFVFGILPRLSQNRCYTLKCLSYDINSTCAGTP